MVIKHSSEISRHNLIDLLDEIRSIQNEKTIYLLTNEDELLRNKLLLLKISAICR